jgi:hypothetical protein
MMHPASFARSFRCLLAAALCTAGGATWVRAAAAPPSDAVGRSVLELPPREGNPATARVRFLS